MGAGFAGALQQEISPWLQLRPQAMRSLEAHYELLLRWNRVVNLTTVTEAEAAARKHYAESLFLGSCCPQPPATAVDIGSGAGFPGVPLAALWPDSEVTLVESDTRKAAFLRECRDLLPNVRVECIRAEHLRGRFDVVVSRAVRPADVVKFATRCAGVLGLILAAGDVRGLKVENPRVAELPGGGGVALWANVPRETTT